MRASDFSMDVTDGAQQIDIVLSGTIDEMADLTAPRTGGRLVTIDCGAVRRLNSRGAAVWCNFIRELTQQGPLVLRRLSPIMVLAGSMIKTFIGDAKVESYISPWDCESCGSVREMVHQFGDEVPTEVPCASCKRPMEFGSSRESYDAFAGR